MNNKVDDGRLVRAAGFEIAWLSKIAGSDTSFIRTVYGPRRMEIAFTVSRYFLTSVELTRPVEGWEPILDPLRTKTLDFADTPMINACYPFTVVKIQELQAALIARLGELQAKEPLHELGVYTSLFILQWAKEHVAERVAADG